MTNTSTDSGTKTREFFDRYFTTQIAYPSNQVDAVVGFFRSRGFDEQGAAGVATVLLQRAKRDNVNVFELLDGLKSFDRLKLTALVAAILNTDRSNISKIGYRSQETRSTGSRSIVY